MHATVKGRYDADSSGGAISTLVVNAGDVNLGASITDAPFANGLSLSGLSLSLEKPGSFIVDYNVPKLDVRFQFMNTVRVVERPLNLTYTHGWREKRTVLDGMLVVDLGNKLSASYGFDSGDCKLKYSYTHRGNTTIEPCYDLVSNSWDFAVLQRFFGEDMLRASYQTSSRNLGMEWSRNSKLNGGFKISASLNLAEELKFPKLIAETTWNFDM